jgi:HEAT repeat protein
VRSGAVAALGILGGPETLECIIHTLENDNFSHVRKRTAESLLYFDGPEVTAALMRSCEKDNASYVQEAAAVTLAFFREPGSVDLLIKALDKTSEYRTMSVIAMALGEVGDERAVGSLISCLYIPHDDYDWLAEQVFGPRPGPLGYAADAREWAAWALGRIGSKEAVEALKEAFKGERCKGGGYSGESNEKVLKKIRRILLYKLPADELVKFFNSCIMDSPIDKARYQAAIGLGETGGPGSMEILVHYLENSSDDLVRQGCAEALGMLGCSSAAVVLTGVLADKDRDIRKAAAKALGRLGDSTAVGPLSKLLVSDKDEGVQSAAVWALGMIGNEAAFDALAGVFENSGSNQVLSECARSLGLVRHPDTYEFLLKHLSGKKASHALRGFGYLGDKRINERFPALLDNTDDWNIKWKLSFAMQKNAEKKHAPGLLRMLKNDMKTVYSMGIPFALVKIDRQSMVPRLIELLDNCPDNFIRAEIIWALNDAGASEVTRIARGALLDTRDGNVREAAALALAASTDGSVDDFLEKAWKRRGIEQSCLALAWRKGGKYLMIAQSISKNNYDTFYSSLYYRGNIHILAEGRRGSVTALEEPFFNLETDCSDTRLLQGVISLMPEGSVTCVHDTDVRTAQKQDAANRKWFRKNRRRLAWNEEKQRYFLKPEGPEKK